MAYVRTATIYDPRTRDASLVHRVVLATRFDHEAARELGYVGHIYRNSKEMAELVRSRIEVLARRKRRQSKAAK